MKYANPATASSNSINSLSGSIMSASTMSIAGTVATSVNSSSFEELVSKLFSCNIVMVLTDSAKQYLKCCFGQTTTGATFANLLNQFASVNNLKEPIRDLNAQRASVMNKLQFRFFDVEQFKSRPAGHQLKKLHFDVISSMSNSYLNSPSQELCDDSADAPENLETPWYDLWRNIYIDTFEPSDHDFIGSSCGCFFVITKHELPHYKVIFERLCSSVKQNSSLRFIQADFVRYFIVLSDQALEANSAEADEYTRTCQSLKTEFPNSFVFYLEQSQLQEQLSQQTQQQAQTNKSQTNAFFVVGDGTDSFTSDMNSLTLEDSSGTNSSQLNIDPLNAANLDYPKQPQQNQQGNSRFYNALQSQRNAQLQNSTNDATGQGVGGDQESGSGGGSSASSASGASRELFSDWVNSAQHAEHLKQIAEIFAPTIDSMLREFISKSLVPWAERQIKTLGELIAQRKGFRKSIFSATKSLISNMSSSTASLTKTLTGSNASLVGGGMPSGVIYIPDAQEMQQRKLADICMIFGCHDMAYNLYYAARKDFQTEGAWLYYAGACEMTAISSYFMQKLNPSYFDQAITTYLDTCRAMNLATRATILATELYCQMNRHLEAANLFIRLTGDDSDVRSALFLEQASKCYMSVVSGVSSPASTSSLTSLLGKFTNIDTVGVFGARYRKAAFHYILAGHRYNKCGLKHFALLCYRRFNYPHWEAASDHVNLTVAKLFLNIATVNLKKFEDYFYSGLDILRRCSHKQIFFLEFMRELKKYHTANCDSEVRLDADLFLLQVPNIHSYLFLSFDSLQPQEFNYKSRNQRHTCFVGEQIEIQFHLSNMFPINVQNFRLICAQPELVQLETEPGLVQFESPLTNVELTLRLTPKQESEFSLVGMEFTIDGIAFRRMFSDRLQQSLNFKAVRTLPLIPVEIAIPQLGLDYAAVHRSKHAQNSELMIPGKVYGSEMLTLKLLTQSASSAWTPATIQLYSSAKQFYLWPPIGSTPDPTENKPKEHQIPIQYGSGPMDLQIHIPPKCDRHVVSIRLVYTDEQTKETRTVLRKLSFEVIPCLDIEAKYDSVMLLRNLCLTDPVAIWDSTIGADEIVEGAAVGSPDSTFVTIPIGHACYLLTYKTFARWTLPTMQTNYAIPDGHLSDQNQTTVITPPVRNGMILFS